MQLKLIPCSSPQDGSFYMEFGDFCTYFGYCKIVDVTCFNKLSEDGVCHADGAAGYWVAGQTAGGRLGLATFDCNPKFELTGYCGEVLMLCGCHSTCT